MQNQTLTFDNLFTITIKATHLGPSWAALQSHINDAYIWAHYTKLAGYCSLKNIPVAGCNEEVATAFISMAAQAGKPYISQKIALARRCNQRLATADPTVVVPPLGPPIKRATPRRDQFDALPPALRADLLGLRKITGKSWITPENLILRMITLAEAHGQKIRRFGDLYSRATLNAFDRAAWGVVGITNWRDSELAKKYRYEFLIVGRRWADKAL